MSICSLRIDPEEVSVPATRSGQLARYAEIRARLNKNASHIPQGSQTPDWMAEIIEVVCRYYGVPPGYVTWRSRTPIAVLARQVVMYLADQLTVKSLAVIGQAIERDASTVWHGARAIESEIELDPLLAHDLAAMRRELIGDVA